MSNVTGGCLCRRVRWEASGEPAFTGACHCRNCQRYTGSAFGVFAAFPADSVTIDGELRTFEDTGESGRPVYRRFCPNCGSGVATELDTAPGVIALLAGTFDDPSAFKPGMELYWDSAQPWVQAGGERQRFAKMPG
jgi:hypothetical protein